MPDYSRALSALDRARTLVNGRGFGTLSEREAQILTLAAAGYLDKEIAAELKVTRNTLSSYWRRIRSKVGHANRVTLAVAYIEDALKDRRSVRNLTVGHWQHDLESGDYRADKDLCEIFKVDPHDPDLREKLWSRFAPRDRDECRNRVFEAASQGLTHVRDTRELAFEDGSSVTATVDVKIEFNDAKPSRASGVVMAFL